MLGITVLRIAVTARQLSQARYRKKVVLAGQWKLQKLILAQGRVKCHKVPVHVLLVPKNRLCARNLAIY